VWNEYVKDAHSGRFGRFHSPEADHTPRQAQRVSSRTVTRRQTRVGTRVGIEVQSSNRGDHLPAWEGRFVSQQRSVDRGRADVPRDRSVPALGAGDRLPRRRRPGNANPRTGARPDRRGRSQRIRQVQSRRGLGAGPHRRHIPLEEQEVDPVVGGVAQPPPWRPTEIAAEIIEEGSGPIRLRTRWEPTANLVEEHTTTAQRTVNGTKWPVQHSAVLARAPALETYRPMLSYDELGGLFESGPANSTTPSPRCSAPNNSPMRWPGSNPD
jgi:hypothetical protein